MFYSDVDNRRLNKNLLTKIDYYRKYSSTFYICKYIYFVFKIFLYMYVFVKSRVTHLHYVQCEYLVPYQYKRPAHRYSGNRSIYCDTITLANGHQPR